MPRENILHESLVADALQGEHRRSKRIYLQVPLFVRGRDSHGEQFMELAKTLDISAIGAFVACPRAPKIGDIITLTVPAPSIASSALVPAATPPIQAKVKRQQEVGDVYLMGVEFLEPIG
jgi:hypothetical protein